jgi:arsenite/tail-anchored protein-transporting ATPase
MTLEVLQAPPTVPRGVFEFLDHATRGLFFTGKGGVGKTSLSAAAALLLADAGKSVLLVSTDAASNLDERPGVVLRNTAVPVPCAPGLSVLNIDPDNAAESYRQCVLAQLGDGAPDDERAAVREQLAGACTTEMACFDEFAALLSDDIKRYDHVVFDTAPTGHTLRLLSLPKAWTGFLHGNDGGASCLGPHSGLKLQELHFKAALQALMDVAQTTVVLVTRPDKSAIAAAARTSDELHALGLHNQRLVFNGVFYASQRKDAVARAIEDGGGNKRWLVCPQSLRALPQDQVRLRTFDMVGLPALRALLQVAAQPAAEPTAEHTTDTLEGIAQWPELDVPADDLASAEHGLIMVMGKGGVGKTTVAAALGLVTSCGAARRSASRPYRTLCLGLEQKRVGGWHTRPVVGHTAGGRTKAAAAHGGGPGSTHLRVALVDRAASRRGRVVQADPQNGKHRHQRSCVAHPALRCAAQDV